MLQHDNTRPRTTCTAHDVVASLKFEIVSRPPYSPDLIPSYFLPELRRTLKAIHFKSDDEVKTTMKSSIESKSGEFFICGMKKHATRRRNCI